MILPYGKQFASPDLSRRLFELGINATTTLAWMRVGRKNWHIVSNLPDTPMGRSRHARTELEKWPAYSVAELGELLRGRHRMGFHEDAEQDYVGWAVSYHQAFDTAKPWIACLAMEAFERRRHGAETEADARALLLADLVEQKVHVQWQPLEAT